jgi:hypothetical protein
MESPILPKAGFDHWPIALQMEIEATPKFKHSDLRNFGSHTHISNSWQKIGGFKLK